MTSLKTFLELYRPKSGDEQKFVDKHVVIKHKDRNGNDDDVFKASKVKTVKRSTEHGYDPGDDEKIYEETDLEEGRGKKQRVDHEEDEWENDTSKGRKFNKKNFKNQRKSKEDRFDEELDLDESVSKVVNHLVGRYGDNIRKSHVTSAANDFGIDHSKLSRAVRKKLGKTMLDEISKQSAIDYKRTAEANLNYHSTAWDKLAKKPHFNSHQQKSFDKHDQEAEKRYKGIKLANKRIYKEGDVNKLTREDVIISALNKYLPEDYELPTQEEALIRLLEHMTNTQAATLLELFLDLNEENQAKMLELCEDKEYTIQLLDFALSRGE